MKKGTTNEVTCSSEKCGREAWAQWQGTTIEKPTEALRLLNDIYKIEHGECLGVASGNLSYAVRQGPLCKMASSISRLTRFPPYLSTQPLMYLPVPENLLLPNLFSSRASSLRFEAPGKESKQTPLFLISAGIRNSLSYQDSSRGCPILCRYTPLKCEVCGKWFLGVSPVQRS